MNKRNYKHGESYARLHNIWGLMKQRILNPNSKNYKYYGGRGITICPEWTNDYIVFRDWALTNGYKEGLQIHRENDGNYEPDSCKWVTRTENLRHTRKTITMEIADEIRDLYKTGNFSMQELGNKYSISKQMVSYILNNKNWKNV